MIAIDMPMPKACYKYRDDSDLVCPFYDDERVMGCCVNGRKFTEDHDKLLHSRHDWCPLIDLNERKEGTTHE